MRYRVVVGAVGCVALVFLVWWYSSTRVGYSTVIDYGSSHPWRNNKGSPDLQFDPSGNQSLVFVHVQKTGGTEFMRHLVTVRRGGVSLCSGASYKKKDTNRARCTKPHSRENWLVAKKTIGWVCGVHPFYSELRSCLTGKLDGLWGPNPSRQLIYFTMLRHPVLRYVSEYLHVQREATWSKKHTCAGKKVTDREMPPCYPGYYKGSPWEGVTLREFLNCSSNWAANRQTLALASLEEVGCFEHLRDQSENDHLLQSAKENLQNFSFFGITEYYEESVLLFERTFGVEFGNAPDQKPLAQLHSSPLLQELWQNKEVHQRVLEVNKLDRELYQFALGLFAQRLSVLGVSIDKDKVEKDVASLTQSDKEKVAQKYERLDFKVHR